MAESEGIPAMGTKLERGNGETPGPETFTEIAEVKSINGLKITADTEEVTNHGSPGGFEEVVVTVLRTGELTLDVNFLPGETTQASLLEDLVGKVKTNYKLIFPTTPVTTWSFAAYVTGIEPTADHSSTLEGTFTLKPTGQPTLA